MKLFSGIFDSLFGWLVPKQKTGQVLLNVAYIPGSWFFFGAGIFDIYVALRDAYELFVLGNRRHSYDDFIVFGLCIGILFVILSFGRVKICQNGILASLNLISWGRIEAVEWVEGRKSHTLKVKARGKAPAILRLFTFPIPIEKKTQVEALLEKFLQK